MKNQISRVSRILMLVSAAFLVMSIFVPIWQIDLDAPQYPEGLILKIYADKLGGDVEIINGLNHYIGMKTLHSEDFIEFSILKYIILSFAFLSVLVSIIGQKKILFSVFALFVVFGIVAMADFWWWEYTYGHDLDPHAAIIVPGMAYQPPLIGFKQLLNFGAYSIPDIGGWLFISSGLFMLTSVLLETKFKKMTHKTIYTLFCVLAIAGCISSTPDAIKINRDNCDNCKMSISDKRFACSLKTEKGRTYKFDDISCMVQFKKKRVEIVGTNPSFFVNDFLSPNNLISTKSLYFVESNEINSPMGGNIAAFSKVENANQYQTKWNGKLVTWELISK